MLRIFSPCKIRWLQPGSNPQTWVPKASMLLLDYRSHVLLVLGTGGNHLESDLGYKLDAAELKSSCIELHLLLLYLCEAWRCHEDFRIVFRSVRFFFFNAVRVSKRNAESLLFRFQESLREQHVTNSKVYHGGKTYWPTYVYTQQYPMCNIYSD
jgi:hypothetical protein